MLFCAYFTIQSHIGTSTAVKLFTIVQQILSFLYLFKLLSINGIASHNKYENFQSKTPRLLRTVFVTDFFLAANVMTVLVFNYWSYAKWSMFSWLYFSGPSTNDWPAVSMSCDMLKFQDTRLSLIFHFNKSRNFGFYRHCSDLWPLPKWKQLLWTVLQRKSSQISQKWDLPSNLSIDRDSDEL